ncbi:S-adenosylmethionine:tRNA ribosyltransferase-isomerase [Thermoplasmatales archaeon AK]|nr:S-adenosylmethionine:tRNA ribosyltransferase-isomerase [Thermoplasmatales archaeon AK]
MPDTKHIFSLHDKAYSLPPELSGRERSAVNLLYINSASRAYSVLRFADIVDILEDESLLVFNDSLTIPAKFTVIVERTGEPATVHVGSLPGHYVVEIRSNGLRTENGDILIFPEGGKLRLLERMAAFPRYWIASPESGFNLLSAGLSFGSYINYGNFEYRPSDGVYVSEFARNPGSVEYPSASRPFTEDLILRLKDKGVNIVTLTLHCNLASLDADEFWMSERLLPEHYSVSEKTASALNAQINSGGKIIAVGTSVVRALETVYKEQLFTAGEGWTDIFIRNSLKSPISGLITGMHDPSTSHILLLGAFCPLGLLVSAYQTAEDYGFRWHEFGDAALLMRDSKAPG